MPSKKQFLVIDNANYYNSHNNRTDCIVGFLYECKGLLNDWFDIYHKLDHMCGNVFQHRILADYSKQDSNDKRIITWLCKGMPTRSTLVLDSLLTTYSDSNPVSSFHVEDSIGSLKCIGPDLHLCKSNPFPSCSQCKVDDWTISSFEAIQWNQTNNQLCHCFPHSDCPRHPSATSPTGKFHAMQEIGNLHDSCQSISW